MAKEYVKEFSGKIIGSIETLPNGDKIVRDFYNVILGKYDKAFDVTRKFNGQIIARGDQAAMLLSYRE